MGGGGAPRGRAPSPARGCNLTAPRGAVRNARGMARPRATQPWPNCNCRARAMAPSRREGSAHEHNPHTRPLQQPRTQNPECARLRKVPRSLGGSAAVGRRAQRPGCRKCGATGLVPVRKKRFDPGFEGSGRWRPCVTQRARGFEGSAAPRRRRLPWDFAFSAAWPSRARACSLARHLI